MEIIQLAIAMSGGFIVFLIVGWFTGNKEYGGVETNDDERAQLIKQKSIVNSWILLLIMLIFNVIHDFIGSGSLTFKHLPLFYLFLLVGSYFVYYWIYSRRLSGNEK